VKRLGSTERKNKTVLTPTGLLMEGVDRRWPHRSSIGLSRNDGGRRVYLMKYQSQRVRPRSRRSSQRICSDFKIPARSLTV